MIFLISLLVGWYVQTRGMVKRLVERMSTAGSGVTIVTSGLAKILWSQCGFLFLFECYVTRTIFSCLQTTDEEGIPSKRLVHFSKF